MAHNSHSSHAADHSELGHIIPFAVYRNVLIILLILTIITVAVSRVDFGVLNIVVAMAIASVKAGIVAAYFMHLKYENPIIWIYVLFPIILLFLMMGGIFVDNPTRRDPKIYYEVPAATENQSATNH
ncbi:MAG: cytochrome C oxidase subunit IV family protein [Deltaproteobacteria bacterium]|nr:cytochrome C oxidase subunit IV family protein [Deltaproteobacteria bacterium]